MGSGFTRESGIFCFSRYWMKLVLFVLYWSVISIMGLSSKSAFFRVGEWKVLKR